MYVKWANLLFLTFSESVAWKSSKCIMHSFTFFTVDKCEADSTKNGYDSDETLSAFSMDDSDSDATFVFDTSDKENTDETVVNS